MTVIIKKVLGYFWLGVGIVVLEQTGTNPWVPPHDSLGFLIGLVFLGIGSILLAVDEERR